MSDDDHSHDNIPRPDPSLATNERLAAARSEIDKKIDRNHADHEERMIRNRTEVKGWVEALQVLLEAKISSAEDKTENLDRVVQTRLAGSETALNAAMAASDKVVVRIETGVGTTMNEMKSSFSKQMDSLNEKIDDLKERVSETGGHRQGIGQMVSLIIAAIAAIGAIAAVIITLSSKSAPEQAVHRYTPTAFYSNA